MNLRGHSAAGALAGLAVVAIWAAGQSPINVGVALPHIAVCLSVGIVGGLLPDLDIRGGWLARRIGPWWQIAGWSLRHPLAWWCFGGHARPGQSRVAAGRERVRLVVGHRALSHSLLGMALTLVAFGAIITRLVPWALARSLGASWRQEGLGPWFRHPLEVSLALIVDATSKFGWWWRVALGAGYMSHILLDMCTVRGVRLWLPWRVQYVHLVPLTWRQRGDG